MKKKVTIEVDMPDCIDPIFIKYLSMLDEYTFGYIAGQIAGNLWAKGLITDEELSEFTEKIRG